MNAPATELSEKIAEANGVATRPKSARA